MSAWTWIPFHSCALKDRCLSSMNDARKCPVAKLFFPLLSSLMRSFPWSMELLLKLGVYIYVWQCCWSCIGNWVKAPYKLLMPSNYAACLSNLLTYWKDPRMNEKEPNSSFTERNSFSSHVQNYRSAERTASVLISSFCWLGLWLLNDLMTSSRCLHLRREKNERLKSISFVSLF